MELQDKSKMSRFLCLPMGRGKAKSAVGKRFVRIVEGSSFCPSSPLLKKVFIQNINVFCIVIETSGSQSLQVLCASAPYLIKLLSKSNPKLKRLLEDEKIASCVKYLQDVDLEPLLMSLCSATVSVQSGVKKIYPVVCVRLGRDAMMLVEATFTTVVRLLYSGLLEAFRFVCEDLPPFIKSLYAANATLAKLVAKNLPATALLMAKGFVTTSLFSRRMAKELLKAVKWFMIFCRRSLRDTPYHEIFVNATEDLYKHLKFCVSAFLSSDLYEMCFSAWVWYLRFSAHCVKKIFPIFWKEYIKFLRKVAPELKRLVSLVIHSPSTACTLAEDNILRFLSFCRTVAVNLNTAIQFSRPYFYEIFQIVRDILTTSLEVVKLAYPHVKELVSFVVSKTVEMLLCLGHNGRLIFLILKNSLHATLMNLLICMPKFFNTLCCLLKSDSAFETDSSKLALKQDLNKIDVSRLYADIQPVIRAVLCELQSSSIFVLNEIINTSYTSVQEVVPSVWCGLGTVTPATISATFEVVSSFKDSVVAVYPVVAGAAVAIRPEVTKALSFVLQDGTEACVSVTSTSYRALLTMTVAAKSITIQLPIVIKAIHSATLTTSSAVIEVSKVSHKAQSVVRHDLKNAVSIVNSSICAAENELVAFFGDVLTDMREMLSENPEVLEMLRQSAKNGIELIRILSNIVPGDVNLLFIVEKLRSDLKNIINDNLPFFIRMLSKTFKSLKFSKPSPKSNPTFLSTAINNLFSLLKHFLHSVQSSSIDFIKEHYAHLCIESLKVLSVIIPFLWNNSKYCIFTSWLKTCRYSSACFENTKLLMPQIWSRVNEFTPVAWLAFQHACSEAWEQVCRVSPVVWEMFSLAAPVIWCSGRGLTRKLWAQYVQNCERSWDVVVPVTSATWALASNNLPGVWFNLCEGSKYSWESFCSSVEIGWIAVTRASSSTWEALVDTISTSWNTSLRPMAKLTCYSTVFILTKSIEVSHFACVLTQNFTSQEVLEVYFSLQSTTKKTITNELEKEPKLAPTLNTKSISRKRKRKALYNAIKTVSSFYVETAKSYSNFVMAAPLVKRLLIMSKQSFIPICDKHDFGQVLKRSRVFTKTIGFPVNYCAIFN